MVALCTLFAYEDFPVPSERATILGQLMRQNGRLPTATVGGAQGTAARAIEQDFALRQMMVAAQAGDRVAYDRLLREIIPLVQRMARQQGINSELVDDVVQDVLLTVHRARHTYDPARSLVVWISMITHRRAMDALRARYRRAGRETYAPTEYEAFAAPEPGATPQYVEEHLSEVKEAIQSLPEAQREAVERLALQEQTLQEAAQQTGRSKIALKVNLHRALKVLRDRVGGNKDND